MPHLHEILSSIHRLENAVAVGERKLAQSPDDISSAAIVAASAKLLRKKRAEYEAYIRTFKAEPVEYSVYTGRFDEMPQLREVCSAFTSFETAVLLTAQSKILDQPQLTRRMEKPIEAAALRYGYLASLNPRHLAFVAATRGERRQLEFPFDDTVAPLAKGDVRRLAIIPDRIIIESARDISKLTVTGTTPENIAKFSKLVGPAILVEVNEWCHRHASYSLDMQTTWGGVQNADTVSLRATSHQLAALQDTIGRLSDDTNYETIETEGVFYQFNSRTRHFSFESDTGQCYGGRFKKDMFNNKRPAKIPKRYKVALVKKTRANEALGTEVVTYEIASYEEI